MLPAHARSTGTNCDEYIHDAALTATCNYATSDNDAATNHYAATDHHAATNHSAASHAAFLATHAIVCDAILVLALTHSKMIPSGK